VLSEAFLRPLRQYRQNDFDMKARLGTLDSSRFVLWSGHIFSAVFQFLQVVAITRVAGLEAMGIYVAVMTVTNILVRMLDFGLPSAILFFIRKDSENARAVAQSALLHVLATIPCMLTAAFLLRYFPFEAAAISETAARSILVITVVLILQLGNGLSVNLVLGLKMYATMAMANILPPLIMCVILLAASWRGGQVGAADLFEITAVSNFVPFAFIAAIVAVRIKGAAGSQRVAGKTLYQYGVKTMLGVAAKVVSQRLDRLVLSTSISPSALSQYAVATTIRDGLLLPFNAYSLSFMNDLMDLQKSGRSMLARTKRVSFAWFMSSSIMAGVAAGLMPMIIPALFGGEFRSSVPIVQIVLFSAGFQCVTALYYTYFLAEGRPFTTSWLAVWSALVTGLALVVLVPAWGLTGAGIAIVASAAISAASCVAIAELLERGLQKRVAIS